jgi:Methyltransferase domain
VPVVASTGYEPLKTGAPNAFADPLQATRYEAWHVGPGRRADRLEIALLRRLLVDVPEARSVLEIGVGRGHVDRLFAARGFEVIGIDLSFWRKCLPRRVRMAPVSSWRPCPTPA